MNVQKQQEHRSMFQEYNSGAGQSHVLFGIFYFATVAVVEDKEEWGLHDWASEEVD